MTDTIDSGLQMGAVSLSVADLGRSLAYYTESIGLQVLGQTDTEATLGVGERVLLHLREQAGARQRLPATGLFHLALLLPSRAALGRVLTHFADQKVPVDGASDHLVSEALYLSDPDGHGIEIYCDRPRSAWYDAAGNFKMDTLRLDIEGVFAAAQAQPQPWTGLPPETVMGHVHLRVDNLTTARDFYVETLGLDLMATYPGALFVSAGGYHHHLGLNTWQSRGASPPPPSAARLLCYEVLFSSPEILQATLTRLESANIAVQNESNGSPGYVVRDPAHNELFLRVGA